MLFVSRYIHIKRQALIDQGNVVFSPEPGSLDSFLEAAYECLAVSYPRFYKMDRLSKLGFLGAEMLLKGAAGLQRFPGEQVALVLANANGSLDTDIRYAESIHGIPSPSLFVYTLPNIVAGEICIRHRIQGENAFFILPAFDPHQMVDYVVQVMDSENTNLCVAGWVDVLGDHHDVFIYLVEKEPGAGSVEHNPSQIQALYAREYGTTHQKS